ncbi:MAG: radical SAM protein [Chloroflexota bacterium]|nr:radical SAM protein [Chloroflexota bacterium]
MKVLLVQPTKAPITIGGEDIQLYEPLALEYIASGIISEHEVRILDMRIENSLLATLNEFKPDVVGLTSYTVNVNTVKGLSRDIKNWNPKTFIVVGGHHATVSPDDFLIPSIDLIVRGEGVLVFKQVIERIEKGDGFDGIPGIAMRKGEGIVKTPMEPLVDFDILPFPERGLTEKYRNSYFGEWMKPLASIRTSKGCPFRCNFCAQWKINEGRYLRRSPEKIVEELGTIHEKFVFFADDESLTDYNRMKTLARLIKEAGLKQRYFLYSRSDTVVKHPDLLEMWRSVGLERVFVGLEFFRDEDLKYISKKSTIDDNKEAVRILHDLDISIYASFIIRPEFNREDFKAFKRYCRELNLDFATFAVLTPLPGTDFYNEVESQLITHNYDYFDFIHTLLPTTLPLKDFYEELHNLYRQAIPATRQLSQLRKYRLRDIPSLALTANRVYNQVKMTYRDYNHI